MVGDQREFGVVEVFRVEKVALVTLDIVHYLVDIRLECLWFAEKDK